AVAAAVFVAILAVAGAGFLIADRSSDGSRAADVDSHSGPTRPSATGHRPTAHKDRQIVLRVRRIASLTQPIQDAAVTALGSRVYAFGGLDASGASTATVSVVRQGSVARAGTLPVAIHDAAAATAGGRLLILGGGQSQSYPAIATFDP